MMAFACGGYYAERNKGEVTMSVSWSSCLYR